MGLALARGRAASAGALLGLATLAKVFPVLLLPWVVSRRPLRAFVGFTGVVLAGCVAIPATGLAAPLGSFARDFAFNAPLFMAVRDHLPGSPHAWVGAALALWLACARLVEPRFAQGAALALLGFLLLAPTVHYWYLSSALLPASAALPAAAGAPTLAWVAMSSAALFRTYADAIDGLPFVEHRELTRLAALAPLALALAFVVRARACRERPRAPEAGEERETTAMLSDTSVRLRATPSRLRNAPTMLREAPRVLRDTTSALRGTSDAPRRAASEGPMPAALSRFGVIVPARDEAQNLATLVPDWLAAGAARVVVVDAPTGDGTQPLCAALAVSDARVEYLPEPRRGYGRAVLVGLAALRTRGVEFAVVCDADNQAGPEQVRALLSPFEDRAVTLVTGARGRASRLTRLQCLGNALTTVLIALRFGRWYEDLGPFRALRLAAWPKGRIVDAGYGVNVEQNVRVVLAGERAVEVRLDTSVRRHGTSTISGSLRGALRAGHSMLARFVALSECEGSRSDH